jgi:hypothetical protein
MAKIEERIETLKERLKQLEVPKPGPKPENAP